MHITEFNSSYSPTTPLHDTNRNAAYIASLLARLGETSASYSYWTFGDIFEESGVPFTPFHGGFGLVANGLIPKPTFWTFRFFKRLTGDCVHKSGDSVIVRTTDGAYRGTAWHTTLRTGSGEPRTLEFVLPADSGEYAVTLRLVDEDTCNPLKVWHDIGEPASPSAEQIALLREAATPLVTTSRIAPRDGKLTVALTLKENAVAYFEISKADTASDRGFDYERSVRGE
jgi:xylan 1,4-beta-xylosidase